MSELQRSAPAGSERPAFGWIQLSFSRHFAVTKLCATVAAATVLPAVCSAAGQGSLGLLLLLLALWPYRFRFIAEARGLKVSWLFITEWIGWHELTSAEVISDPRAFVIGPRPLVLRLDRGARNPVTIQGDPRTLHWLRERIDDELRKWRAERLEDRRIP